jgi:hypothetical protein
VNAAPTNPPAYSTKTWTYGSQIWSDRIVFAPANCNQTNSLSTTSYTTAEYKISGERYYYSWNCALNNATTFCPSPWRMPTRSDFETLVSNTSGGDLKSKWGAYGNVEGSSVVWTCCGYYWATTDKSTTEAYSLQYDTCCKPVQGATKSSGLQVRCVK